MGWTQPRYLNGLNIGQMRAVITENSICVTGRIKSGRLAATWLSG